MFFWTVMSPSIDRWVYNKLFAYNGSDDQPLYTSLLMEKLVIEWSDNPHRTVPVWIIESLLFVRKARVGIKSNSWNAFYFWFDWWFVASLDQLYLAHPIIFYYAYVIVWISPFWFRKIAILSFFFFFHSNNCVLKWILKCIFS